MRKIILALIPFIFIGCNQEGVEKTKLLNSNNPYLKVKPQTLNSKFEQNSNTKANDISKEKEIELTNAHTIKLEELKVKKEEALAKISAQKEQKLKEIEAKTKQELSKNRLKEAQIEQNRTITIAQIEAKNQLKVKKEESNLYKILGVLFALVIIFGIIFKFLNSLAKRRHEVLLKEKELEHQAYLQDMKAKHEHISKMLEIISDENSDKEIKKSLTKLLEGGKNNLIDYKKS